MRIIFLVILFLCVNCSSTKNKELPQELLHSIKIDLVFEKEIKGNVFGLSIRKPYGLAIDFQSNIYVADAGNNRILKFDSSLNPIKQIGGFGSSEGLFNSPTFISFDNGLNLMVTDEKNHRVQRFNSQLQYVDEITFFDEDDPLKFGYPSGVTFTNYGETWIADRDNSQVAIFNNIGQYSHSLGQFGASGGQLSSPEKILRDENSDFLVCDANNRRVVRYNEYGNYLAEYKHKYFEYPVSVALLNKKILVLDAVNATIFYLDKKGSLLSEIGAQLLGDKKLLLNPSDFLIISGNKVLISDTGNDRLVLGKLIIEE